MQWEVAKHDFMSFLKEFHTNGKIVRGANNCLISLILKECPQKVSDYILISVIGCTNKVLANKMRRVMH